jgi:hypothetical protein
MKYLLCRNRVADFRRWKRVFDSHASSHRAAGLHLNAFWRAVADADNVVFLFEVRNMRKARAFISAPAAARAAAQAGVIEGDYHFLNTAPVSGYGTRR